MQDAREAGGVSEGPAAAAAAPGSAAGRRPAVGQGEPCAAGLIFRPPALWVYGGELAFLLLTSGCADVFACGHVHVGAASTSVQGLLACQQRAGGRHTLMPLSAVGASSTRAVCCGCGSAGSFSLTVEVADWDLRAQLAGIPRTLSAAAAVAAAAEPSSQSLSVRAGTAAATAAAGEASAGVGGPAVGSSPAGSPRVARQRSDGASLQAAAAEATAAAGDGDSASAGAAASVPAEMAAVGALGSSVQQPPPVAVLDLVVKAFDTQRWGHACTHACMCQALLIVVRCAGCTNVNKTAATSLCHELS